MKGTDRCLPVLSHANTTATSANQRMWALREGLESDGCTVTGVRMSILNHIEEGSLQPSLVTNTNERKETNIMLRLGHSHTLSPNSHNNPVMYVLPFFLPYVKKSDDEKPKIICSRSQGDRA